MYGNVHNSVESLGAYAFAALCAELESCALTITLDDAEIRVKEIEENWKNLQLVFMVAPNQLVAS